MENRKVSLETLMVMESKEQRTIDPHVLPIYATSGFSFQNIEEGIDAFLNPSEKHLYSRFANPTIDTVATKLARLESYDADGDYFCLLTNTGMSAITTALVSVLEKGDIVLTQPNIYGGSTELMQRILSKFGVTIETIDLSDIDLLSQKLTQKEVKLVYFETPANPTLSCLPIEKLAALAKEHNAISIMDNTFATPALQRPLSMGVDIVIHSTTKYLNGHGNGMGGAIIAANNWYGKIWGHYKLLGTNPSPFEAWLLHNGMKTLSLRMEKHSYNAQRMADFLSEHPSVDRVNYPGLTTHPDHEIAASQMAKFGGMMSFELKGGFESGKRMMNEVDICQLVPTLGNVDTLILHPASMSHLHVAPEIRRQAGISDGLIRMSVGIENIDDLIADLDKALAIS